ncbi:MAG: phosphatidate cytidylyltransferase [Ruminococcus sp.]|nr:phosphatidate cytidylyltransferase [Ruminococcus sp.]
MKTRIISSAVGISLAVILIALHETFVFNIAIGAVSAVAIAEIFKAAKHIKYTVPALMCCAYAFIDAVIPVFHKHGWLTFFTSRFYFGALVLAMCVYYLKNHETFKYKSLFFMLGVAILIPYSFGTLIYMAMTEGSLGVYMIVITLCAAWLADSGAYFAGTFFGKTKLCPDISPNKTVEGLVGGVIANGVFMLIVTLIFDLATDTFAPRYVVVFFAGMAAALVGLIGDLTASEIKRQVGIKDYGNVMPGHGGIMDRFDSVLLVAPFMYYLFIQGALIKL